MIDLVSEVGSASANSFVSLEDAESYFGARLRAEAWHDAVPDDKKRALIEIARDLNSLTWLGQRSTGEQALAWPRSGVSDPDAPPDPVTGRPTLVPDDEVPRRVAEAAFEGALEYLRADRDPTERPGPQVRRRKVDVIETEWFEEAPAMGLARFSRVIDRIAPLMAATGWELVRT